MIILVNIGIGLVALVLLILVIDYVSVTRAVTRVALLVISFLLLLFFNMANNNGSESIHKKTEVKEILTTDKVLTVNNDVVFYEEGNLEKIYEMQKSLDKKESRVYLVRYKKAKSPYDNTFFNRHISTGWELVEIEEEQ